MRAYLLDGFQFAADVAGRFGTLHRQARSSESEIERIVGGHEDGHAGRMRVARSYEITVGRAARRT